MSTEIGIFSNVTYSIILVDNISKILNDLSLFVNIINQFASFEKIKLFISYSLLLLFSYII